jgi:hypothetical protein
VLANPATHPHTGDSIRSRIERITLTPNASGALEVEIVGEIVR